MPILIQGEYIPPTFRYAAFISPRSPAITSRFYVNLDAGLRKKKKKNLLWLAFVNVLR